MLNASFKLPFGPGGGKVYATDTKVSVSTSGMNNITFLRGVMGYQ